MTNGPHEQPLTTGARPLAKRSSDGAQTVIGRSIVFDGEISGAEDLVVLGTVKGKIALEAGLYVEESGVIEADVASARVEVLGHVTGDIVATERVDLQAHCRVVSDIRAPRVLIADLAVFKGSVDMDTKES